MMVPLVKCVLLIDDDKATNFFNKMILGRHGSFDQINTVQSGHDALEYLNQVKNKLTTKPNLIFLDINMPGMNGWEFLLAFDKLGKEFVDEIKVILLSTSSDPDDIRKSIDKYSVADYINKPLSIDLISKVMNNHFLEKNERTNSILND